MSLAKDYFRTVRDQVDLIGASQMEGIERAGDLFAQVLCGGQWIYLFGTGHSHMIAEELFYRAGLLDRRAPPQSCENALFQTNRSIAPHKAPEQTDHQPVQFPPSGKHRSDQPDPEPF